MDTIDSYSIAMIAFLVFVLIVLVQGALVGAAKAKAGLTAGSEPPSDYDNPVYRTNRSHQNGVETLAAAATVVFACILLGVSAWWVNLLMGFFLLTRIVFVLIYAQKIGNPTQGLRTFTYVAGWAALVVLCVMAIIKAL